MNVPRQENSASDVIGLDSFDHHISDEQDRRYESRNLQCQCRVSTLPDP